MDATAKTNLASIPYADPRDQASKLLEVDDGLIPLEYQQSSAFEPEIGAVLPSAQFAVESSSLNNNLLSILQRPAFLESPAARWTAPPQWLQFQMLRSFDEGLMVNENQPLRDFTQPYPELTTSIHVEEFQNQVQINLHGLLQNRRDDSGPTAAARWQIPESWAQSSVGTSFPVQPSMSVRRGKDVDGLIVADRRTNDTLSTPRVTCSFGLMQQTGYGERKLEFFGEKFSAMDAEFFAYRVKSQAANTVDLMFLMITDWQPWFAKPLQEALPDFPIQALLHFSSTQTTSMLPSIDYNEGELTCIMEHINTKKESKKRLENEREIDLGTSKAHCLPLVVWTRARGAIRGYPDRALIVIISRRTDGISSKITSHYSNDRYSRWDRLARNQAWVYLDLYFLFTKWERIWGAVKQNLQRQTEEVHGRQTVLPIQQQTRQLHKDNNIMISLREHVRIHKASMKIVMQRVEYMLGGVDFVATQGLKGRLDDAFQLLEYYEVTATTLLEQQQNLLSLAFNLETVAQGQAVARLNALAFIFLPLSFVASVFGITTFTIQPQWYPVAAVPTLCTTVLIAYAAHKFFASAAVRESRPKPIKVQWSDDLEDFPSRSSRVSNNPFEKNTKIFFRSKERFPKERTPTPGNLFGDGPSINDPSRLIRRSTDLSLADRQYIPPRSTVQFLPGAYDFSGNGGPLFYTSASGYDPIRSQPYDFATSSETYNFGNAYLPQLHELCGDAHTPPEKGDVKGRLQTPLSTRPPPPERPESTNVLTRLYSNRNKPDLETRKARAIADLPSRFGEFGFNKGDMITVLSEIDKSDEWWLGRVGSQTGIFPNSYVEILPTSPAESPLPSLAQEVIPDETSYRTDGPDFGLPPDTTTITATNEDLYSAEETYLPTSPTYIPYKVTPNSTGNEQNQDIYSADAAWSHPQPRKEQNDVINYGEEFQEWDKEFSFDRGSDLQAALVGMDIGRVDALSGPNFNKQRSAGVGSSRKRIGELETIEE